jgi:hypothetical protein
MASRSTGAVNAGAGWVLGLIAYALFSAYINHGTAGPKGWLKAKFLNEPMTTGTSSGGGFGAGLFGARR